MPTPIGRGWLVTDMPWRMITAVDVAIIRTKLDVLNPYYCVQWLNSDESIHKSEKQSSGTTRPRITRRELSAMSILLPKIHIQEQYHRQASDLYNCEAILRKQNLILRKTRDFLLPKLISGELDVSELDIIESPEMNNQ